MSEQHRFDRCSRVAGRLSSGQDRTIIVAQCKGAGCMDAVIYYEGNEVEPDLLGVTMGHSMESMSVSAAGTPHEPLNVGPMGVNSNSHAHLHVRPMGRTCRCSGEIKENPHPNNITALFRDQAWPPTASTHRLVQDGSNAKAE